jgi:hypothetical protein
MRKTYSAIFVLFVAAAMLSLPGVTAAVTPAQVGVAVSINTAPPPLLVYTQPLCPGPGYIWTPGYWAWGPDGYYWVPGTWVVPPEVGLLWTPGYWGWGDGVYIWHAGYWGPHVGFYGGINYGFGYTGFGYYGGYWRGGAFVYNTRVNRIDRTIIHNTYSRTVVYRTNSHVSYNGGRGGINARPTSHELTYARERHFGATANQERHVAQARSDRRLWASENHGHPSLAATRRPLESNRNGVAERNAANRAAPAERTNRNQPSHNERSFHATNHNSERAANGGRASSHAENRVNTHRAEPAPRNTVRTNPSHDLSRNARRTQTNVHPSHSAPPRNAVRQEHGSSHSPAIRENTRQQHGASRGASAGATRNMPHASHTEHGGSASGQSGGHSSGGGHANGGSSREHH